MRERIGINSAEDSIFGYIFMNDWSALEVQMLDMSHSDRSVRRILELLSTHGRAGLRTGAILCSCIGK
jgi:2-keto-4-pentenoate hydratase/2-oxohepta-3-ene-1,7-dioic acid hydratase in catechol pathway